MRKTLDEEAMQNELAGSAFFQPTLTNDPRGANESQTQTESSLSGPAEAGPGPDPESVQEPVPATIPEHQEQRPVDAPLSDSSPNEPTNVRTNEPLNERSIVRKKIRHTFDVFPDQLLSLRRITVEREDRFGKRVLLGDLIQEALDLLIAKERTKE